MTGEEWALAASVVFSGLWSGLLGMLTPVAWNPEAMPSDWEAGRRRYFALNWIQAAATWTGFALFLGALVSL